MSRIKLSEYAKKNNVCYRTVWNWLKQGKLSVERSETGRVFVLEPSETKREEKIFVYARVSSYEKKNDLLAQAKLCEQFCLAKGWVVSKTIKEVASGMNDSRKGIVKLFEDNPTKVVILYKDRLTRFGFNYLVMGLKSKGCEVIVINDSQSEPEDLLKDFIAVITSFCCRLYGARRGQAKALKIKEDLKS